MVSYLHPLASPITKIDRPIRVGHLLTSVWAGGLENFALTLASGLSDLGVATRVYSWTGDDHWKSVFEDRGIEVVPIGGPIRIQKPADVLGFAIAWFRLAKILRKDRIDILHTHDFLPALIGRTASLAAGVPSRVTTYHNLYDWWPSWSFLANRILSHWTDAIVCVSQSVRQFMIRREGLKPERYLTILNGVDETRFKPDPEARVGIRRELAIAEGEILIGSVGSITTRKAQWILAKAVAPLVREGYPIQIRIWGASASNPQHAEKELIELIHALGIEERFQLLPPRKDIERIYNAMDIHCMTSTSEGLSLASVEAMMCGVVPLYSDIGPFKEVVADGETGFLFRSGSPSDLETSLKRCIDLLLHQEGSLTRIGSKARLSAADRFSMSRFIQEWFALYSRLNRRL